MGILFKFSPHVFVCFANELKWTISMNWMECVSQTWSLVWRNGSIMAHFWLFPIQKERADDDDDVIEWAGSGKNMKYTPSTIYTRDDDDGDVSATHQMTRKGNRPLFPPARNKFQNEKWQKISLAHGTTTSAILSGIFCSSFSLKKWMNIFRGRQMKKNRQRRDSLNPIGTRMMNRAQLSFSSLEMRPLMAVNAMTLKLI